LASPLGVEVAEVPVMVSAVSRLVLITPTPSHTTARRDLYGARCGLGFVLG
jgi:hypothetical protein